MLSKLMYTSSIFVDTVSQHVILSDYDRNVRLFQKEHEQRRRRKSKAQLYEMIQAIRR